MADPAVQAPAPRWHRRFEREDTFGQEIDPIGLDIDWLTAVQAWRERPGRAADYALRRLLTAWRIGAELSFPFEISAEPPARWGARYTLWFDGGAAREIAIAIGGALDTDLSVLEGLCAGGRGARDLAVFLDRDAKPAVCPLHADAAAFARTRSGIRLHVLTPREAWLRSGTNDELRVWLATSYETDYVGWIFDQVGKLEGAKVPGLDLVNVAEELGDLGRSKKHAIQSQINRLMVHVLKWTFQTNKRTRGWAATIYDARRKILRLQSESPSLKPHVPGWIREEYPSARDIAHAETGLPLETFPEACPYSMEQLLDRGFPADLDQVIPLNDDK